MDKKLLKYIPKRFYEAVSDVYHDEDGYWVYLKNGWRDGIMDTHVIHTDTIKELREEARLIYKED
jgi:nitrogen fixation protein